jgi:membrane-associated protease RseP (regulator of RpoE activity)
MYFLGVLFVALGISVSIALHEVGHLLPAKRFGVKVTQYMVGFGPTIWSRRRGETEYGLKAVPLGGYVRMIGMFPPRSGADPSMLRASSTGRFSQLMDQAREESMEQVKPGDEDRVFYKLSTPRKLVVMLGGPTMNLVIAVVLLTGIFTLYGIGEFTTRVSAVSQCVQTVPANGNPLPTCSPSDPQAPANVAGIRPGDRVISLAGQPVSTWDDVRAAIRPNGGRQIEVVVDRDGRRLDLTATPIPYDMPRIDDQGNPAVGPDGKVLTDRVGFMGFSPSPGIVKQPLAAVPALIGDQARPHSRRGAQDPAEDGRHRQRSLRRRRA